MNSHPILGAVAFLLWALGVMGLRQLARRSRLENRLSASLLLVEGPRLGVPPGDGCGLVRGGPHLLHEVPARRPIEEVVDPKDAEHSERIGLELWHAPIMPGAR